MSAPPWFRFYTEAIYDRKLRKLKPDVRWLFVVCLSLARRSPLPGVLMLTESEPVDWDDLVDAAAMTLPAVEKGMTALDRGGLVKFDDGFLHAWFVPKWDERQYESDSSTERVKRFRERQRNVSGNGSGTRQRQSQRQTEITPPTPPASQGGKPTGSAPNSNCVWCDGTGVDKETGEACPCERRAERKPRKLRGVA